MGEFMEHIKYPTIESIQRIAKDLKIRLEEGYMQDWEYEVADAKRISEFIAYYKQNFLNTNEKITIMTLILSSYDDYINEYGENFDYSREIKQILISEPELYLDIVKYWACESEDFEDFEGGFAITPFVKQIRDCML